MAVKRGNKRKVSVDPEMIERDEKQTRINDEKKRIRSFLNREVNVSAKNVSQKDLIKSILRKEISICSGPAGTGKTFISLGLALGLLRAENNKFTKIYLVKSVTTLKGEEIGYFQFGGSTHCVIFRPGVIKEFKVTEDMSVKFGQTIAIAN